MKTKMLGLVACALLFQNCSKVGENVSDVNGAGKQTASALASCYTNPLDTSSLGTGGDPFCMKYNGTYYMYRPLDNTVVYNTSTDLINWTATQTVSFANGPSSGIWAPEVHQIGSTFYLVYANPNGVSGGRDIMVCKMSSPTSCGTNSPVNIVGSNTAEICIDPSVYEENGHYYLIWKNVGTGTGDHSRIRIRELNAANATQFASGSSQSVIFPDISTNPLNKEHPFILREGYTSGGVNKFRYYLFFDSGQGDTQDYKVEYATSSSLLGTYTYKGTLMSKNTNRGIYSIGGHSVVRDGSNYRWMVYRGKSAPDDGWDGRRPRIDRLRIDALNNTADCEATTTQSAYCPAPL
jgi:beta-xylosidase